MTQFGRHMLEMWALEPETVYLNHGTVGTTPKRVLAAQQAIRDEIERQPSRFLLRELTDLGLSPSRPAPLRMREAAEAVASFLGARGCDLVFVDNATAGINAVLAALDLGPGDEILHTDHVYGAIANAAVFTARRRGAAARMVELPFPVSGFGPIIEAVEAALGPHTRLAIVEAITSESALIMPLAEIIDRCRAKGVPVLVDGAHAPGVLPLAIPALGADWFAGNLHKWAYAPRSCGFLWAAPHRQASLHPPVISWGLDKGFTAEFDWVGTRDPSAFLAAPEGIAMMNELGFDAIREWNHTLVWEGARLMAGRWGTPLDQPEAMIGSMATFPLPERFGSDRAAAARLRDALLFEDRIEVQIHPWRGRLWVRISAQIYNDMSDMERLANAVASRAQ